MRTNATLQLLRAGQPAIGTWLQLYSVPAARLLAAQGCFQWMLVDFEHTPVDYATAQTIFASISDISAGHITPLARVATGSIEQIKQALDCGAQGVIAPMVNTADEAAQVVRYARFPPEGERGGGGLAPHLGFGINRPQYLAQANSEILVAVQIETREAVDNIASILSVPGLDMVFIGPNDLHMSLGMPARFWSSEPRFLRAVHTITSSCQAAGIPYGTLCRDTAAAQPRLAEGFTFLGLGSDAHFLLTHAGEQYGELHSIPEPEETWCNRVGVFDRPQATNAEPALRHRPTQPPPASARAREETTRRGNNMTIQAPTADTGDFFFDPNAPGFNEDPFPIWAQMRENTPIYWWEPAQGWIVTRYDDVLTTLTDPRFSVEFRFYGPAHLPDEQLTPHQLLTKYGIFWLPVEDHDRVRALTAPLFTPRAVEPLRDTVRTYVADLIDNLEGKRYCDLVSDFVLNYPVGAITRILGIPGDRRPEFLRFAQGVLDAFYPAIGQDAFESKTSYLTDGLPLVQQLIHDARTHRRPGLMSALVNAEKDGERLSDDELLSMVGVVISAGSEPTRHLVLGTLYNLLRHRDQLDILKDSPELLANAVGEVGRYDSMGKLNFPRFALEDLQIRGVPIKAGTPVFGVFASALRDPKVFPEPDRFDIRRDLHGTLLWSKGIHNCLGRPIAQMITEEAVCAFIDRFPDAELHSEPVYVADSFFRKMGSLTVNLGH